MKETQTPGASPAGKAPPKKPNIFLRLLAFLVTLSLVLGAVALVAYRDKLNFDSLKRWFTYRTLEKNDSGQAATFSHKGGPRDAFAAVGNDLLMAATSGIWLYSGSGTVFVEEQTVLEHPVVCSAGAYSLAYDAGGRQFFVFKDREQVFSHTLDEGRTLLSVRINASGYLSVTTQATGYKGSVLVYGPDFSPLLQLNLSSSFIMDAAVTNDSKSLAVVTIGESASGFESRLLFYRLDRTEQETGPDAACSLGNSLVLDLRESSSGFWALCENAVYLVGLDGELAGSFDYGGRYLKEFSMEGDGFVVALLGKYRAGTLSDLTVVDLEEHPVAFLSINEQIVSLSAAGRYIAVLTADRLDIYTSDLTLYDTLEGAQGARKVLMRPDGTALLIGEGTARLYIPT